MPNIKSAMKRAEQAQKRAAKNASERKAVKTAMRRFREALGVGNEEATQATFRRAVSKLDQAAQKGLIHRNAAARKKSRLARKLNHAGK
ncbi:MAG: 30S ribosomal protein S20 [Syntrophomonadaceae bacterium]|nr:30S ribosomal protein S20 [Syntrophomonadaceae bacterium]